MHAGEKMTAEMMDALMRRASGWADGDEVEIVSGPLRRGEGNFDRFAAAVFASDDESEAVFTWCELHCEWELAAELDPRQVAGLIAWRELNETRS